jgi:hypothetical protein
MTTEVETRAKLARLPSPADRCDPTCKGWFVDAERLDAQRCDECWHGIADPLTDDEVELLPEFAIERTKLIEVMHTEEHGTAYSFYADVCPLCLEKISWLKRSRS